MMLRRRTGRDIVRRSRCWEPYRGRVKRRTATVLAVVAASLAATTPVGASPGALPLVSGGTAALGNPAVVALATYDGRAWSLCSAAMVRPRVLMTAAHCLTKPNSSDSVVRVRVFPPGRRAKVYANTGPRRPSPVRVEAWWRAADYRNGGSVVRSGSRTYRATSRSRRRR